MLDGWCRWSGSLAVARGSLSSLRPKGPGNASGNPSPTKSRPSATTNPRRRLRGALPSWGGVAGRAPTLARCLQATYGARPPSAERKRPRLERTRRGRVKKNRRRPTLPGPCGPSTIGAEGLNGSVRKGKRCFPLAIATGNLSETPLLAGLQNHTAPMHGYQKYPSSPRLISTSLLQVSPPFQSWPINLVIFQESYSLKGMGELISRPASRLDAFSGYPIRT